MSKPSGQLALMRKSQVRTSLRFHFCEAEWEHRLGLDLADDGDPHEEAEAWLQALVAYQDRLDIEIRSLHDYAAGTFDDTRRAGALKRARRKEFEAAQVSAWVDSLWGRTRSTRPVIRNVADETADLRCRCGCGRIFRTRRERIDAPGGWHPICYQAAMERSQRLADTGKAQDYVESLSERLA